LFDQYLLGFSRYGLNFEFPLTFEDCCPRYRIRNATQGLKLVAFIKKAIKEFEDNVVVNAPLLSIADLPRTKGDEMPPTPSSSAADLQVSSVSHACG